MTVPGNIDALLLGGQRGYQIERSLRFNSADSAYLNRTPASAGNRKTWTWSGWVKQAKPYSNGGNQFAMLFGSSSDASNRAGVQFNSDTFQVFSLSGGSTQLSVASTAVLRDPSAWYHFVVSIDSTQAVSSDRAKLYINGSLVTALSSTTYPTQNTDLYLNNTNLHGVGGGISSSSYFDGYLTEVHFIDGQALTPSSFGETDTITGVWKPKKYAGTYGTNGFYLKFADNSGTTSTTLGKDSSGNGNNWTPNNFSVTAGAGNDSMIDTPTPYADGGNGRGNYATWNPLSSNIFGSNFDGNLKFDVPNIRSCLGNFAMSSGKWYCEISMGQVGAAVGIAAATLSYTAAGSNDAFGTTSGWGYVSTGNKRTNGSDSAYGASWIANDIIGVAYDADAGSLTFYKNGVSQGTAFTGITVPVVFAAYGGAGTSTGTFATLNAGQRAFAYTPPTGFLALNTQNLPEPSIKKPSSYMGVITRSGLGTAGGTVSGLEFQPDLIWEKQRNGASSHYLFDAVRGLSTGPYLSSNATSAESSSGSWITGATSTGYTVNSGDWGTSATVVSWCWDESATPGFDIVTFTGNGSAPATISHSLGVAPKMMIVKNRDQTGDWVVYHSSITNSQTGGIFLNLTNAWGANSTYFNNSVPTSSNFQVGSYFTGNNIKYVAYLWSEVAGFSKFGSYTGNGSTDGPFVFTGHRSRWILIKDISTGTTGRDWFIVDTARNTYNVTNWLLRSDLSDAETSYNLLDITSNGFKLRGNDAAVNNSGSTYIFAAFAESPFKYSLAR